MCGDVSDMPTMRDKGETICGGEMPRALLTEPEGDESECGGEMGRPLVSGERDSLLADRSASA